MKLLLADQPVSDSGIKAYVQFRYSLFEGPECGDWCAFQGFLSAKVARIFCEALCEAAATKPELFDSPTAIRVAPDRTVPWRSFDLVLADTPEVLTVIENFELFMQMPADSDDGTDEEIAQEERDNIYQLKHSFYGFQEVFYRYCHYVAHGGGRPESPLTLLSSKIVRPGGLEVQRIIDVEFDELTSPVPEVPYDTSSKKRERPDETSRDALLDPEPGAKKAKLDVEPSGM